MNGKLRINLNGKEVKLWFNNFTDFEMQNIFGKDLMQTIEKRVEENELSFTADLIWIGVTGQALANDEPYQLSKKEIRLALAEASLEDLSNVSKVFFEAMGSKIEKEEPKGDEVKKK